MKTHAALQAPMAACGTLVLLEVGQAQTLEDYHTVCLNG